jgi:hypothetical protein
MSMHLVIGPEAISSYQRLSYTPWHAIAEFVDNSTQSYADNQALIDERLQEEGVSFQVSITYEPNENNGMLRVADNSIGMSYADLERALRIAVPPANRLGRSRYGMGMKTAAFWIGRKRRIQTKKIGEDLAHEVTIDANKIAETRDMELNYRPIPNQDPNKHYTIVEVWDHYRKFQGRTLGKIAEFLRSMYRRDLQDGKMKLVWRTVDLTWEGFDERLMIASDGTPMKRDILFTVNDKVVMGWVGILRMGEGGRADAGFSVMQANRVILGWPEAWRPTSLFGPYGSNDLVNQRLVGELEFDGFEVSHTKDSIQWRADEEEAVEKNLKEAVGDYKTIASKARKGTKDQRGPAEADVKIAVEVFERELESAEMVDQINLNINIVPSPEALAASRQKVITSIVQTRTPTIQATISTNPPLTIKLFLGEDLSDRDAYVYQEATQHNEIVVTVNQNHPYWATQLRGAESVLEYLRQCTYDALAEWQASKKVARFDSETIKYLKDGFLRLPMDIERHRTDKEAEAEEQAAAG